MLLWFVATAVATVWFVFRDPRFDYRPLIVGALVPDAVDVWFGGARVMHSVVVAMAVLVVVMVATIGRRRIRQALLAVPIGMMLHLVFDGAFADAEVFWWPLSGTLSTARLPVVERGWWSVVLEIAGACVLWAGATRLGLRSRHAAGKFLRTGCLGSARNGYP